MALDAVSLSGSGREFDMLFRVVGTPIGAGQFGQVFRCRPRVQKILDDDASAGGSPAGSLLVDDCACKILKVSRRPAEMQRMASEVDLMRQSVSCPNIVAFFGCFLRADEGELILVMELCALSLNDLIEYFYASDRADAVTDNSAELELVEKSLHDSTSEQGGTERNHPVFPEGAATYLIAGVVRGIAYLHANKIVHRDIKSANVLVTSGATVKLGDFGVARRIASKDDKMKTFVGSPYWMSPEAISRNAYSLSTDVWSIGIVLLEILEGAAPLQEIPPMKAVTMIPKRPAPRLNHPELYSDNTRFFLRSCLQTDPTHRLTASELADLAIIRNADSHSEACLKLIQDFDLDRRRDELEQQAAPNEKLSQDKSDSILLSSAIAAMPGRPSAASDGMASSHLFRFATGTGSRLLEKFGMRGRRKFFGVDLNESWESCVAEDSEHIALALARYLCSSGSDCSDILIRGPVDEQRAIELATLYDTGRGNSLDLAEWDPHDVCYVLWCYLESLPTLLADPGMFGQVASGPPENQNRAARDVIKAYSLATVSVLLELVKLLKAVDANRLLNGVSLKMAATALARRTSPTNGAEQRQLYARWYEYLAEHGEGILLNRKSKTEASTPVLGRQKSFKELLGLV